jgi:chemotaxis protein MotB
VLLRPLLHNGEGGGERWLITYSDMITLLLVMFIILYSTANTDLEKFKALAQSLNQGFGATAADTSGDTSGSEQGTSPVWDSSGGGDQPVELFPENQTPIKIFDFAQMLEGAGEQGQGQTGDTGQTSGAAGGLKEQMQQIVNEMAAAAGGEMQGLGAEVQVTYNERGIMITIFPDQILFDSGSAVLKPGFKKILQILAPQLKRLPNSIEVDGHTDNVPISTAAFPSNWELSAARAGSVVRYFETLGLPSERLAAAGYADTRPVESNDTRQGRARNRRVEIIVLRQGKEQVNPNEGGGMAPAASADQSAPADSSQAPAEDNLSGGAKEPGA